MVMLGWRGTCCFLLLVCRFADPLHWLEYFPPRAKSDLKSLGLKVRAYHTWMHTHYTYAHMHTCTHMHTYTHAYMHTYTHYTHAHIHTHIHTCIHYNRWTGVDLSSPPK